MYFVYSILNMHAMCFLLTSGLISMYCVFVLGLVSIEYRRRSSEGYPTKVDRSAEMRVIENKKVTETQGLDRFGLSA